jgi:heme-degrading monooxygenase HmoA
MFAVIFEVQPKTDRWDEYLALAKQLKPKLEAIEGFIDNERFESKKIAGRILSLSTWRNEKAVVRWRIHGEHHGVQEKGRSEILEDYHLRVGEITADSAPPPAIPIEEKRFDETEIGAAKICTITEISPPSAGNSKSSATVDLVLTHLRFDPGAAGLLDYALFESIYNPGKLLILGSWRDPSTAKAWTPMPVGDAGKIRHRTVRIIRDYGMFERREAPQFYPDVAIRTRR